MAAGQRRVGTRARSQGRGWHTRVGNPSSAPYSRARCLTLWTPVFSSVGMEVTLAGRGCEGQRDTLLGCGALGPVSALKETAPVIMLKVGPSLHQPVPGEGWGRSQLLGRPCPSALSAGHLLLGQASGGTTSPQE